MSPGTILFDRHFVFHDGEVGEKLLVVLTDGRSGQYIVAKTTSNGSRYGLEFGCQLNQRFPCYFLPRGSCCLDGNSWLCLDEFYEFEKAALIQRVMERKVDRIGILPESIAIEVMGCAMGSDDISVAQGDMVRVVWEEMKRNSLESSAPES